jgi:hypothetical protein
MHGDQEHLLVTAQMQEATADQRANAQVKRLLGFLVLVKAKVRLTVRLLEISQVDDLQREMLLRRDLLSWAVLHLYEDGAQGLVSLDEGVESAAQGAMIEDSAQASGEWDVICSAAAFQLVDEPQALLGPGGGNLKADSVRRSREGFDPVRLAGTLLEQSLQ